MRNICRNSFIALQDVLKTLLGLMPDQCYQVAMNDSEDDFRLILRAPCTVIPTIQYYCTYGNDLIYTLTYSISLSQNREFLDLQLCDSNGNTTEKMIAICKEKQLFIAHMHTFPI